MRSGLAVPDLPTVDPHDRRDTTECPGYKCLVGRVDLRKGVIALAGTAACFLPSINNGPLSNSLETVEAGGGPEFAPADDEEVG